MPESDARSEAEIRSAPSVRGVTNSGRVLSKVPESDARSVHLFVSLGRLELALRAVEVALAAASVLWLKKPERE